MAFRIFLRYDISVDSKFTVFYTKSALIVDSKENFNMNFVG